MEELNKKEGYYTSENVEESAFSLKELYTMFILHWPWIFLSIILFTGLAYAHLRYTTPTYQATTKMLIKEDESSSRQRTTLLNAANLGFMSNSTGIENEVEILASNTINESVVRNLKLYVDYSKKGRLIWRNVYGTQPVTVDMDSKHLEELTTVIDIDIERTSKEYIIKGQFLEEVGEDRVIELRTFSKNVTELPASFNLKIGLISFTQNPDAPAMKSGDMLRVQIYPIDAMAKRYVKNLNIAQSGKQTSIANITITDVSTKRAIDYLNELASSYNAQANDDKNEIAIRTEQFINSRLEKINTELGATEGAIEAYKKQNDLVAVEANAAQNMQNANQYDQRLVEMETQIALLNSVSNFVNMPANRYETLPSNVGLTDQSASMLINKYNELVMERNYLLRSASPTNDAVVAMTQQLDELLTSIRAALRTASEGLTIQRNSLRQQASRFRSGIRQTPEQERVMGEIGRQREVQISLYTMLLEKREENSISLAATADKGRIIDKPKSLGQVAPKRPLILALGFMAGLALPFGILILLSFFRYKIEGHDDVQSITNLPIIADVAVANMKLKTKGDIVVHENRNNMMEEIYRSMRTNVQFMLKESEQVIMFTSSTSGEGKTFNASNLAVCFALLGKKVALVGLDIRKPRLAELFELTDKVHGITNLLIKDNPTWEDISHQIIPSGTTANLDLLMAGPIPPNPAELITRPQLAQVINLIREHYDYVILDTAPVGLVSDSLHLTNVTDLTICVCRADYTSKNDILMLNGLAEEGKLKNPCLVINGIDLSKKKYGMAYGYGKYGRYGKYSKYGYSKYGAYGKTATYSTYGRYGNYANSHYGKKKDDSIKR